MKATATFFRKDGRLRVKIQSVLLDKEFWMERAGTDHRYQFGKVTCRHLHRWHISEEDYERLHAAKDGDVVEFKLNPKI